MDRNHEMRLAFQDFFNALKNLRLMGVLNQNRDITSQLGEWLVESILEGRRAKSGIQKDWDIEVGGRYVQVKSHAKAAKNTARWTTVKYGPNVKIDELIICVFSADYLLREFYRIPWADCLPLIRQEKDGGKIYWNHVSRFRVEISSLPRQELVQMFL